MRGRSHLNVSAVMKKVPNEATVKVIALRHQNNMEKIAVKKFTQFPVKLDDVVRKKIYLPIIESVRLWSFLVGPKKKLQNHQPFWPFSRKLIVVTTEDGSTNVGLQILYSPYLILGVFGSYSRVQNNIEKLVFM